MAKSIVQTLDMDGHVGPAIPMVRKLIECNHQVAWLTGRKYKNRIKATGATFRPLCRFTVDDSLPNQMSITAWFAPVP